MRYQSLPGKDIDGQFYIRLVRVQSADRQLHNPVSRRVPCTFAATWKSPFHESFLLHNPCDAKQSILRFKCTAAEVKTNYQVDERSVEASRYGSSRDHNGLHCTGLERREIEKGGLFFMFVLLLDLYETESCFMLYDLKKINLL